MRVEKWPTLQQIGSIAFTPISLDFRREAAITLEEGSAPAQRACPLRLTGLQSTRPAMACPPD
jgi:hypothetical protein